MEKAKLHLKREDSNVPLAVQCPCERVREPFIAMHWRLLGSIDILSRERYFSFQLKDGPRHSLDDLYECNRKHT